MKIYFVTRKDSILANENSLMLQNTKKALIKIENIQEAMNPDEADALIIQEEWSYKNYRYTPVLMNDLFLSKYLSKLFTLNFDDCATGLLRGLYTNIPKSRLDSRLHVSVPYMDMAFFNKQAFYNNNQIVTPNYIASWRGNTTSNNIRPKMVRALRFKENCKIEVTNSWYNHSSEEKSRYVDLILNGMFSLCPAGFSAPSLRIYESMALGRCPVIISDDFTPPLGPDWSEFALFFPERKLKNLYSFLKKNEHKYEILGLKAKECFYNYFCEEKLPDYYAKSFVSLIQSNIKTTLESEIKRWNGFNFYWINRWTIPQRVYIKISNVSKRILKKIHN